MTALQAVAIFGAVCIAGMLYGFTREGFWTWACAWLWRPLSRFCRHMVSTPRRSPGPSHPAARVIRARRLDLSDEQARIRWQQITEKQLGAQLRPPRQRDGSDR